MIPTLVLPLITCILGICQGGDVSNVRDSGSYDPAIRVYCNYGSADYDYVATGTSSKADCGTDMDQIYVGSGQELWCRYTSRGEYVWMRKFDATGRHKVVDTWSGDCALRRD